MGSVYMYWQLMVYSTLKLQAACTGALISLTGASPGVLCDFFTCRTCMTDQDNFKNK